MAKLSYHTKLRLKKAAKVLGALALIALVLWVCWLLWLQRYVVFTREGVRFDFGRSTLALEDKPPTAPAPSETVEVDLVFQDSQEAQPQGLEKLTGVYVDTDLLQSDLTGAGEKLAALEEGSAVLLDVKSEFGNFYYTTSLTGASQSAAVDAAAMDGLIRTLKDRGFYLIARLPAFRDSAFAEANQTSGLPLSSGALWTDEDGCYWLDPGSDAVLTNLTQICRELREKGFDEVVFTDFRIPDSGSIVYTSDQPKDQVLAQAAQRLTAACATEDFAVSFQATATFRLPEGAARVYLEGIDATQAASTAAQLQLADTAAQTVFLTTSRDTRFDEYGVLRSLEG